MAYLDFARKNIDILYVICITIIFKFLPAPQIFKSFIIMPFIVIIPLRIGYTFSIGFKKWFLAIGKFGTAIKLFILWSEGNLIILFLSFLMSVMGVFDLNLLVLIILIIILLPLVFDFLKIRRLPNIGYAELKCSCTILLLCLNGVMVAMIFRAFSSFPLQPAFDVLGENVIFNKIFYDNFFSIFRTEYSSNFFFNGKTPLFPLIVAIICRLVDVDYISLMWVFPFLFVPLFAVGNYLFAFELTKDRNLSFVASVISAWICEVSQPTFIHPIQSGLFVALLPLLLLSLLMIYKLSIKTSYKIALVGMLFAFSFVSHYFLGTYLILSLIVMYVILKASQKWKKLPYFFVTLNFFILFFLFSQKVGFISLNSLEFDPLNLFLGIKSTSYSFESKWYLMEKWYTLLIFYLSLGGVIYAGLVSLIHNPREKLSWATYYFMLNLLLFSLPIASVERIFPIIHIFIAIFTALLLTLPLQALKTSQLKTIAGVCLILVCLTPIITQPILTYVNNFPFLYEKTDGIVTSFTEYEMSMGKWIQKNTPSDAIIVSEPYVQIALEAFANRPSIEGMYLSGDKADMVKTAIINENDAVSCYLLRQASNTTNETLILIITGRVISWATTSHTTFWAPIHMQPEHMKYIEKFLNSSYFTLLHQIDNQIFAFQVGISEPPETFKDLTLTTCDETTNWIPNKYKISLDMYDYKEGNASIKVTGQNLSNWQTFEYKLNNTIDLTERVYLSLWIKIDANFTLNDRKHLFIGLIDENGNKKWWLNPLSFSITNGQWQHIYLRLRHPDADERADLTKISAIRFSGKFQNQDITIHIDDIRAAYLINE